MIRNVIASYLESVSESDFYFLLQFYLESKGYEDIHFTHGIVELGKDFICKKDGHQYAIVVKAAEIDMQYFRREVQPQLLQAVTARKSHPSFSSERYGVIFATTRRITSPAQLAFSELNDYFREHLKEEPVTLWDYDTFLQEIYSRHLEQELLVRKSSAELGQFFQFLSEVQTTGDLSWFDIERFTRSWAYPTTSSSIASPIIECSMFQQLCAAKGKTYTSLLFAIALFRAVLRNDALTRYRSVVLHSILSTLRIYCSETARKYRSDGYFMNLAASDMPLVDYPRNCLICVEMASLTYLLTGMPQAFSLLEEILTKEPGCTRPISENYVPSVYLCALALMKAKRPEYLRKLIINVTVWIAERYGEFGLAAFGATKDQETEQLLSEYLEGFNCSATKSSLLASVLLFLAHRANASDLYESVANDLRASEIIPEHYHFSDDDSLYGYESVGISQSFDAEFSLSDSEQYSRSFVFEMQNQLQLNDSVYGLFSVILFRDRWFPKYADQFLAIDLGNEDAI